jgi:hypothetical protein
MTHFFERHPVDTLGRFDDPAAGVLEAQMLAYRCARFIGQTKELPASMRAGQSVDKWISHVIPKAAPFGWTQELADLAWHAATDLPDDEVFGEDLMPEGVQAFFWWFQSPLPIVSTWHDTDNGEFDCDHVTALLGVNVPTNQTLQIYELRRWAAETEKRGHVEFLLSLGVHKIPWGKSLADLAARKPAPDIHLPRGIHVWGSNDAQVGARFVLAAFLLLQQRIASTSEVALERHLRKRAMRELELDTAPTVRVVSLRHTERPSAGDGGHRDVDWSCRWIVKPHWRQQPYKDGRRRILIAAYEKGPADKPLRLPDRVVFKVDR